MTLLDENGHPLGVYQDDTRVALEGLTSRVTELLRERDNVEGGLRSPGGQSWLKDRGVINEEDLTAVGTEIARMYQV